MSSTIKAVRGTLDELATAVLLIDLAIYELNEQLKRAQPHKNGRFLILFSRSQKVMLDSELQYEMVPIPGRMIKMASGRWNFMRLRNDELEARFRDYRVGKGMDADNIVIQIINGIEDLYRQRVELMAELAVFRRSMPGRLAGVHKKCEKMSYKAIDLKHRIQIDWNADPKAAQELISEKRRKRYLAKKEKAQAVARVVGVA